MNGYQGRGVMPQMKYKVPIWVIVITVLGLVLAIFGGYQGGAEASYIFSYINIPDGNGVEDTTLAKLKFEDFIHEYKSDDYYNELDNSDIFVLAYRSSAGKSLGGAYNNDYSAQSATSLNVSFSNLTYYDISYVNKDVSGKTNLTYTANISLSSGNMQAAIFELDKEYKCVSKDGVQVIESQYINMVATVTAGGEQSGIIPIDPDKIYVIAFAGENATGNYSLNVTLS